MRILMLEDDPADAELIARELRKTDLAPELRQVSGRIGFERELAEFAPDLVISDHNVPQFSGWDALRIAQRIAPGTPFILVTGSLSEETAVAYMKAGAADYLLKDRIGRLGPAVTAVLEQKRERDEQAHVQAAAAEAQRAQQEFLHAVIDLSPNLVFVKDRDGRFVLVNQAVADLYGTTVDAVIGKTDADFHPNPADVERFLADDRAVIESGVSRVVQESLTDPRTGKPRWLHTVKVSVQLPGRAEPLVLGVATDITERRQLEEQLRLSQKLEAVGTLAGGIAHDFNNLLAAIRAMGELLLLDLSDGPHRADVSEIIELVERASALVGQLLAFSRKQILDARIVDLNVLVERTVKLLQRVIGADVQLSLERTSDRATISADPGQIEQVLMNLCVNARDAMPRGGALTIRTDRTIVDGEFIALHAWARPGDYVRVTVSDTGAGMDEATQARIFEPFFTTKAMGRGTGLGLAVVYGIVKQHDGLIHVYSEPGRGTTFRLYFPFRDEAPSALAPRPEPQPIGGSERILVAEDDDALRAAAHRLLTRLGYDVVVVSTGPEALAVLTDRGGDFDLAILDLVMPGMPGLDVFEQARRLHPRLRFLFATGYSPGTSPFPGLDRLPADVLVKPYGVSELAGAVRHALGHAT